CALCVARGGISRLPVSRTIMRSSTPAAERARRRLEHSAKLQLENRACQLAALVWLEATNVSNDIHLQTGTCPLNFPAASSGNQGATIAPGGLRAAGAPGARQTAQAPCRRLAETKAESGFPHTVALCYLTLAI